eukprot:6473115-Amphidinium_carterae.1
MKGTSSPIQKEWNESQHLFERGAKLVTVPFRPNSLSEAHQIATSAYFWIGVAISWFSGTEPEGVYVLAHQKTEVEDSARKAARQGFFAFTMVPLETLKL